MSFRSRGGFGLIELVVALMILAVAVLGMAAAAVYAHQAFMRAEATERVLRSAGAIIDSLTAAPAPVPGERVADRMVMRWMVTPDSGIAHITLIVDYLEAGQLRHQSFQATRAFANP